MYKIIRSILFLFDAEKVHYFSMNALQTLCSIGFIKNLIRKTYSASQRETNNEKQEKRNVFNLSFKNLIGLGAGFDKNAKYLRELETLGFGFVEIGTVTPFPQDGNPKPRLFRLPKDKALINRMGFNNDGAEKIAERLKAWRERKGNEQLAISNKQKSTESEVNPQPATLNPQLIIGGNIGKNKSTPNEDAWKDYETCFTALHSYVDYFVVNVSSPNTPGLRELQEKESLRKILTNLQTHKLQTSNPKPILLKISPDLIPEQIDDVIDLALEINLDGLVAANTTIRRDQLVTSHPLPVTVPGGLSGLPVKNRSTELVKYIHNKTAGLIPIIASGGIFTGADAKEKIDAGAVLVQVWTGFIYEGPGIVKKIQIHLTKRQKT